jgi:hypothetical protein
MSAISTANYEACLPYGIPETSSVHTGTGRSTVGPDPSSDFHDDCESLRANDAAYDDSDAQALAHIESKLRQAGVPQSMPLAALLPGSSILRAIAADTLGQSSEGEAMYPLRGADLACLFPPEFSGQSVWYFRLAPSRQKHIPALLGCKRLDGFTDHTSNPWRHATYLEIATNAMYSEYDVDRLSIAFEADDLTQDLNDAIRREHVLIVLECAGTVYVSARPFNLAAHCCVAALSCGAFATPLRVYPLHELQARTRALEETGMDPHGTTRPRKVILPVRHDFVVEHCKRAAPKDYYRDTGHLQQDGVCSSEEPAAIGSFCNVVRYLSADAAKDSRAWLRVPVWPELFDKLREPDCKVWVQRAVPVNGHTTPFYVVVVRWRDHVSFVMIDAGEGKFTRAFGEWTGTGNCPLVMENLHNGRTFTIELAWPADFIAHPVDGLRDINLQNKDSLRWHQAAKRFVRELAAPKDGRWKCSYSQAVDGSAWLQQSPSACTTTFDRGPAPGCLKLRPIHIRAQLPEDAELDQEYWDDSILQGVYEVLVASSLSDLGAANCALHGFLRIVPIHWPDEFTFTVRDRGTGATLKWADALESADPCMGVKLLYPIR